jgi:hypothetical protein
MAVLCCVGNLLQHAAYVNMTTAHTSCDWIDLACRNHQHPSAHLLLLIMPSHTAPYHHRCT